MHVLMIGTTELILIVVVCLLLFGGKKIPELMKGLGKGMRSFKVGLNDPTEEEIAQKEKREQEEQMLREQKEREERMMVEERIRQEERMRFEERIRQEERAKIEAELIANKDELGQQEQ